VKKRAEEIGTLMAMPIARLTICEWIGTGKQDTVIEKPAWGQIERAIRALNNENLNDLYLEPEVGNSEIYLCIGGGAGRYVVSGAIYNERFPTMADPDKPADSKEELVVGGQTGDYPGNCVVDLETALRAAKDFYETGGFSHEINWVYL
jgi:hypothetical protein